MEICWVTMKVCQLIGKWRLRSRLGQRERMCYGIGLRSEGPGRTPLYESLFEIEKILSTQFNTLNRIF